MENSQKGCINRDYNGCINIRKLFNCYINNKSRPERYCRGFEIKTTNPYKKVSNSSLLEDKKECVQRVHLHSPEIISGP
jgi:hypothetical protein